MNIVLDTSRKINAPSMAYDSIFDEHGERKIVEISYAYMPRRCTTARDIGMKVCNGMKGIFGRKI